MEPVKAQIDVSELLVNHGKPTWIEELSDEIILVMVGDETICFSTFCPHYGGPISQDKNGRLRCGWHGWCFDQLSGACNNRKINLRLKTYSVNFKEGKLWLEIT
jgi:nitrite reductase/ring-hydroxylating ferredoxin subunit